MRKLCCVRTRQQSSASLDYFVTSSPPYLHQFSAISGGNYIISPSIFYKHSCHHNSECDIINHREVTVCKLHVRVLAKTSCHKSSTVHTIPFHLKYPSTPNQSRVIWTVFSFHMSPYTCIQHPLELQANSLLPFFSG